LHLCGCSACSRRFRRTTQNRSIIGRLRHTLLLQMLHESMTTLQFRRWNVRGELRRIGQRRIEAAQSQLQRRDGIVKATAIRIVVSNARGAQLTRHSRQARVFIVPIRYRGNVCCRRRHCDSYTHTRSRVLSLVRFVAAVDSNLAGLILQSRENGILQSCVGNDEHCCATSNLRHWASLDTMVVFTSSSYIVGTGKVTAAAAVATKNHGIPVVHYR
jgi:hypothetical protein